MIGSGIRGRCQELAGVYGQVKVNTTLILINCFILSTHLARVPARSFCCALAV
jgi:hypothetical protein